MSQALIVSCANGRVGWVKTRQADHTVAWVCVRDQFRVPADPPPSQVESTIVSLVAHSVSLAGGFQSILQLDV